jgi:hypothetical protein
MNTIRKEPEISEVLTRIAWINVNKMPSLTHTRSKPLSNEYALWKNILLKQINEYVPEIIIFGNTFHYFRNDILDSTVTTIYKKTSLDYFIKNNQLFIDAYHPSQMTIKRKIYVNEIIETCREYIQNAR